MNQNHKFDIALLLNCLYVNISIIVSVFSCQPEATQSTVETYCLKGTHLNITVRQNRFFTKS